MYYYYIKKTFALFLISSFNKNLKSLEISESVGIGLNFIIFIVIPDVDTELLKFIGGPFVILENHWQSLVSLDKLELFPQLSIIIKFISSIISFVGVFIRKDVDVELQRDAKVFSRSVLKRQQNVL